MKTYERIISHHVFFFLLSIKWDMCEVGNSHAIFRNADGYHARGRKDKNDSEDEGDKE